MQFKQYFPDEGLTQVIPISKLEWNDFIEWAYNMTGKFDGEIDSYLMRLKRAKEKGEGLFLRKKDPWDRKLMEKLDMDEELGFVGTEAYVKEYHVTKRRYEFALEKENVNGKDPSSD